MLGVSAHEMCWKTTGILRQLQRVHMYSVRPAVEMKGMYKKCLHTALSASAGTLASHCSCLLFEAPMMVRPVSGRGLRRKSLHSPGDILGGLQPRHVIHLRLAGIRATNSSWRTRGRQPEGHMR